MILYTVVSYLISALILPIVIKFRLFIDFKNKKLFYSVFLFGIIRINSGYVGFGFDGFVLHYSDKNAIIVKYKSLFPSKANTELLLHFNFARIHTDILLNAGGSFADYYAVALINSSNAIIYSVLKGLKRFTDYRCDVYSSENENFGGVLTEISIVFNIVSMLEILVKKLCGGAFTNVKRT